jgi:DHA1 family bicyclomycin/chloramphenicol resistance-like MFS transporter
MPRPYHLPFILIISLIACCIELEISTPSFPAIVNYFNVEEFFTSLTISLNLAGFCIAAIIYGPLSEVYGRREVMLIGNFIMLLGAVLCVISPSIEFLIFARFIQGLGAATSAVMVSAIIADVYSKYDSAILCALIIYFTSITYDGKAQNLGIIFLITTLLIIYMYNKVSNIRQRC